MSGDETHWRAVWHNDQIEVEGRREHSTGVRTHLPGGKPFGSMRRAKRYARFLTATDPAVAARRWRERMEGVER